MFRKARQEESLQDVQGFRMKAFAIGFKKRRSKKQEAKGSFKRVRIVNKSALSILHLNCAYENRIKHLLENRESMATKSNARSLARISHKSTL